MSIKVMMHMPYTEHRDFVALSADLSELPYDCGDGSTCIMSDTAQEYIFHKSENEWREETRPIPELAYKDVEITELGQFGVKANPVMNNSPAAQYAKELSSQMAARNE